jgi:hypothetical protein
VIEKGFSQLRGYPTVSIGAVLENTSSQFAYQTEITVNVWDARHQLVSSGPSRTIDIPVIFPRQRISVGDWAFVKRAGSGPAVTVADVEFVLGTTRWIGADAGQRAFAEVAATSSGTRRTTADRNTGTIRYSATSEYCRDVPLRAAAVVFRNSAGRIVGGSLARNPPERWCKPGASGGQIGAVSSVPPEFDDSRTQVDLYCDLGPSP